MFTMRSGDIPPRPNKVDFVPFHSPPTIYMAEAPSPWPEVMDIHQVADYLQLEESIIYQMARAGKIPGTQAGKNETGGKWRFSRRAIDRWLAGGWAERLYGSDVPRPYPVAAT